MRRSLGRAAAADQTGRHGVEALAKDKAVDDLILLTLKQTPEDRLAEELGQLTELYEHRVTLSAKSVTAVWTVAVTVIMTFVVGWVIIAMFQPLITIVNHLGA